MIAGQKVAESVATFAIVMGAALLLSGVGFLVVIVRLLVPATRRREAGITPADIATLARRLTTRRAGNADERRTLTGVGWLAIRWLHVVAMALFVGGQLVLAVAIVPVLRGAQREALRSIARRFGWASLAALAVLAATGTALAEHGSRWDSGTLQVKLGLVVAVIAMIVWHMRRPGAHVIEAVVFLISLAIVWLGLALAHGPLPFG